MESLGLSQMDARPGINGEGELRGQPANPSSSGTMAVKMEFVCAHPGTTNSSYDMGLSVGIKPRFLSDSPLL